MRRQSAMPKVYRATKAIPALGVRPGDLVLLYATRAGIWRPLNRCEVMPHLSKLEHQAPVERPPRPAPPPLRVLP